MIKGNPQDQVPRSDENYGESRNIRSGRKNILTSSLLILVSGITGSIYMILAKNPAYGLFAFLQGPQTLLPKDPQSGYLVETLFLVSLAFAAVGFFLIGRINDAGNKKMRHPRAFRISTILLVVSYAETLSVLIVSVALGLQNSENLQPLAFGTGNALENLRYVSVLVFLLTFVAFAVAGSFFGAIGSVMNAYILFDRHEYIIIMPLIVGGIFYFPLAIAAGLLGIFAAMTETPFLKKYSGIAYQSLMRAAENFLSSKKLEFLSLGLSAILLLLLFYVSILTVPVYANGSLIFYSSRFMSGPSMSPLAFGLVASSMVFSASLLSIFRNRLKFLMIGVMVAVLLTASLYIYFLTTLLNFNDYVQFSRFQSMYAAVPFIYIGLITGMLPIITHFRTEERATKTLA